MPCNVHRFVKSISCFVIHLVLVFVSYANGKDLGKNKGKGKGGGKGKGKGEGAGEGKGAARVGVHPSRKGIHYYAVVTVST